MAFDEQFIRRVYKTTIWVWAFSFIWCIWLRQPLAALGLTIGALVGIAGLRTLEMTVKRSTTPSQSAIPGFPTAKYTLLKYPAYLVIMSLVVLTKNIPIIIGFMAGLGLVHLVIILKAVGRMVIQRLGRQEEV